MRKVVIFAVLLSLLAIPFPAVYAQDGGLTPACSEEELTIAVDALTSFDEGFGELVAEFDLSGDPADAAYGLSLVAIDTYVYEYWKTLYPVLPACAEAQSLGYLMGAIYDKYLTVGLLSNMGAWADAAEMTDDAAVFADNAALRLEELNAAMEEMADIPLADLAATLSGEMLESCTQEEFVALIVGAGSALTEIDTVLETLSDDPVAAFAFTENAAYTFDTEVFSEIAICVENQAFGYLLSLSLNQINIVAGLYANAAAEEAAGNTDVAQAMTTSADQRLIDFEATWESLAEMFAPVE